MTTSIDFSMIGASQVFNLCLQRSNRLSKIIPRRAKAGDDWDSLMKTAVVEHRQAIIDNVFQETQDVFDKISPQIERVEPHRLADLGCGQAFIDLLIYRRFGCDLLLIDIEESSDLHFGFAEDGAGYADLSNARTFLVANGVPDAAIVTVNPRKAQLEESGSVDMAISLLSCGFHYPVGTYDSFFRSQVSKAILLDCRKTKGGDKDLTAYGRVEAVGEEKKHIRYLCMKS